MKLIKYIKKIREIFPKFGLKYCDLPTMVWNVAYMLRALTLNIDSRNTKRISAFTYLASLLCLACYSYVYIFCVVWFVFWRPVRETDDMVSRIIVLSLGLASETGIMKFFYIMFYNVFNSQLLFQLVGPWVFTRSSYPTLFISTMSTTVNNQKRLMEIVDGYLDCDALVIPESRFAQNLMKHLKVVKRRALLFWTALFTNGGFYVIKGLLRPGRHLLEDIFVFYGLEPMYESPNYEIAKTLNSVAVMYAVYVPANMTAFLIILTGYTEAQMLALSGELKNLWRDATDRFPEVNYQESSKTKKIRNEFIKRRLNDIAKGHTRNIILMQKIEKVFRGAIAIEFVFLITGLLAELLGQLENTYLEIPFTLMSVAIDCFIGQNIMDASVVFEKAVYESQWENFDVSNKKTVLLILQNSQRNMTLSSGGMTILSFPCFMSVIRTTYSIYTTLRSTT